MSTQTVSELENWLRKLYEDPDFASPHSRFTEPYRIEVDGKEWAMGACNIFAVAVASDEKLAFPTAPLSEKYERNVRRWLTTAIEGSRLTFEAVRGWYGQPASSTPATCSECKGLGEVSCTCFECDHEHMRECDNCDGTGKTNRTPARYGQINGIPFNVSVGARAIHSLVADEVTVRVGFDKEPLFLAIGGDGWRVFHMGIRTDSSGLDPMGEDNVLVLGD